MNVKTAQLTNGGSNWNVPKLTEKNWNMQNIVEFPQEG